MSQSSVIFVSVLIGFLVFITLRGELPKYYAVLFGPAPQLKPAPTASTGSSGGIFGALGGLLGGLGGLFGGGGDTGGPVGTSTSTITFN